MKKKEDKNWTHEAFKLAIKGGYKFNLLTDDTPEDEKLNMMDMIGIGIFLEKDFWVAFTTGTGNNDIEEAKYDALCPKGHKWAMVMAQHLAGQSHCAQCGGKWKLGKMTEPPHVRYDNNADTFFDSVILRERYPGNTNMTVEEFFEGRLKIKEEPTYNTVGGITNIKLSSVTISQTKIINNNKKK